ncbi:MAG: hypothetical protein ISR78_05860 [Spirochaetia bacterium]|nr:hypothetical protein [Bacteroidota bacterium]MBL7006584.1 hypothetical protein [Spirochaetia bacterium]
MKVSIIGRKICFIAIITSLLTYTLYAEPTASVNNEFVSYEPYEYEEFPAWMHKARRAESLFIGSLPLTYGAVTIAANLFFVNTADVLSHDDYFLRIGISAALSLGIILIDFVLGELHNEQQ